MSNSGTVQGAGSQNNSTNCNGTPSSSLIGLEQVQFKSDVKEGGDLYFCTKETIADYVGVEYGKDMRALVKHGVERTFTASDEPEAPADDVGKATDTCYSKLLDDFLKGSDCTPTRKLKCL